MPIPHAPWFTEARFGMFVHWGLYSLAARHEWVMNRERIRDEDYRVYFEHFNPDLYDPAAWARAAREAGMRYIVLTTKHHEGFCLWDSRLTDFTAVNTPYGRDLVAPFVEAARAEGLRIGFYHSLLDWHHPDYLIDGHHPRRDDPDVAALDAGRDMDRYRAYLHGQVRELLTGYGPIDYLFFDFSSASDTQHPVRGGKGADDWDSAGLLALCRELQPGIVVNDRLDIPGDVTTPEQYQPAAPLVAEDGSPVVWEACQTLNGSWGYDRDNGNLKSADLVVRMLIDGVAKDGNLLLNVGPNGRGLIDDRDLASLARIGDWMRLHARSIHGAGPSPFAPPADVRYTQRGDRLYAHLFAWPFEHLHLPGLAGRVAYAQLLNDASEIRFREIPPDTPALTTGMGGQPPGTLTLTLPVVRPEVAVPVIELFLTPDPRSERA